jgi:hypothetical protein
MLAREVRDTQGFRQAQPWQALSHDGEAPATPRMKRERLIVRWAVPALNYLISASAAEGKFREPRTDRP